MREADYEEIWGGRVGSDADLARDSAKAHLSYVASVDTDPICLFGATEDHPGVWQAFMFATDRWAEVGREVTKFLKTTMIPGLENLGVHRVHCYSHANHQDAHRWLTFLGAEQEARLKAFGSDGSDYFVFTWLGKSYVRQQVLRPGARSA